MEALVGETYRRVSMSTHSISYPRHKFKLIYCASFLYRHDCDRQDGTHTGNIHFFGPTVPLLRSSVVTSSGDASDTQEKRICIRNTHSRVSFLSQLPCTNRASSLTYQILLLRVSVFINTIFRELQSNSSYFKTHLILSPLTSRLLKSVFLSQIYHFLHQSFSVKRIISIINARKHLVCCEGIVVGLKLSGVRVRNV